MDDNPSSAFSKVVVLGAGAVGSVLGAELAPLLPTVLVGRSPHIDAVNQHGLILGGLWDKSVSVKASTHIPSDLSSTMVLITAKTLSLHELSILLKPLLTPSTTLVLACNGYRPQEHMSQVLGPGIVIHRVLMTMGCHLTAPGHIDYWGGGGIDLPDTPLGKNLSALFSAAGLQTELFQEFEFAVWRKLTANCVVNPLTALLNVRNSAILAPELDSVRSDITAECIAVAAAEGVTLPADHLHRLDAFITQSNNISSMLQDIRRGRPTEIMDLNGAVAVLGRKYGVPAPTNQLLTQLILARTSVLSASSP